MAFGLLTLILLYALVENVLEAPDGLAISMMFIAGILTVSLASQLTRALELRVDDVQLDSKAQLFIRDCARRTIRLVANEPDERDRSEYADKRCQVVSDHDLSENQDFIFVEITVTDPSESLRFPGYPP